MGTYRDTKFIRNTSTFLWTGNLAGAVFQSQLASAHCRWRHSAWQCRRRFSQILGNIDSRWNDASIFLDVPQIMVLMILSDKFKVAFVSILLSG